MAVAGLDYQMFEEYYNRARKAEKTGRLKEAKILYLSASESLYKAALNTTGETQRALITRAGKLEILADSLYQESPAPLESQKQKNPAENPTQKKKDVIASDSSKKFFQITEKPKVSFDDIAGLEDVKEIINNRIILPQKFPEIYDAYSRSISFGILLYGPPGTGKTMIAKAIATETGLPFYSIRCSDIVDKYFGEAEKNVKELFDTARSQEKAIIFFDEFDAISAQRGDDSSAMNRLVAEMLSQIDGFSDIKDKKIFILAASNNPWIIDTAFLRPPRLTEKIYVGLPNATAREYLIRRKMNGLPVADDLDLMEAVSMTEGFNSADVNEFCECMKDGAILRTIAESDGKDLSSICHSDLLLAAERIRSSVQQSDIDKIRQWEQGKYS